MDLQNGQQYKVYVGQDITVQYSDGSTEKWRYFGPEAGTGKWQRVPNSFKPAPQPSTSGTGGGFNFQYSGNSVQMTVALIGVPFIDTSLPHGTITVEELSTGDSYSEGFDTVGWFGDFGN
ncbi:MAG: hypothetical protein ABI356_09590 [Steroidobacteraceae bacterium]